MVTSAKVWIHMSHEDLLGNSWPSRIMSEITRCGAEIEERNTVGHMEFMEKLRRSNEQDIRLLVIHKDSLITWSQISAIRERLKQTPIIVICCPGEDAENSAVTIREKSWALGVHILTIPHLHFGDLLQRIEWILANS